ncbi:HipA domain-containing protein [Novosphingobium sp. YAF33]|uniref:HipA domain-containing protein n=1 Tax=Novosphingobium sp. YAF33 TaxID=3233082 RepID=UPI003F97FFE7
MPKANRIPYISARTALGKSDIKLGSYTEIIDFIRPYSAQPRQDFRELHRRLTFTILVSNEDDHLRTTAFYISPASSGACRRSLTSILHSTATRIWKRRFWKAARLIGQWRSRWKPAAPYKGWHRQSSSWRNSLGEAGLSRLLARSYEPAFVHDERELAFAR